ncbi:hypothetical protein GCM10010331_31500 [Streptomyces xanthochromogenes]|uniref:Uncharacterized protein n=1 Tax=Streptomyces xanthochromogenes TaxID=67384 RepID=A0ABQ2ZYD6_9ACTN|nr:hypothetical protein GCM10010326_24230 [Streptomyces xanthochromogenes]GHB41853.1 hypothetical protein GCM10010331_31500 [Streptomyces xanthochromogenes]
MSFWMDGMAMLTMVTSTRSMKAAVITMARANHRRRSAAALAAVSGLLLVAVEVIRRKLDPL